MADTDPLKSLDSVTPELTLASGSNPTLRLAQTATGSPLQIETPATAGATIVALDVYASAASQAVIGLHGVFHSTASLNVAAGGVVFAIPARHVSEGIEGWIPVLARP